VQLTRDAGTRNANFCTKKPQKEKNRNKCLLSLSIISDFYDVFLVSKNKRGLGYSDCGILQ
jgi:hypothetical protein